VDEDMPALRLAPDAISYTALVDAYRCVAAYQ
jgi:hypothetical protein